MPVLEVLTVGLAIATLTSGFNSAVDLVGRARARWGDRRISSTRRAELDRLQQSFHQARSSVQGAYDAPQRRFGPTFRLGDELARYILFALAARQDALLQQLKTIDFEIANLRPLIQGVDGTKIAATQCLNELARRTEQPNPPLTLTLHDQANLLMDFQRLCHSAFLYRAGKTRLSQLATMREGMSSCHRCGAAVAHSRLQVPGADASSCVLIDISGLFRAHCHGGDGLTCIWQIRAPSCYGVFRDEKALLRHMLAVHVRGDGAGMNIKIDWPADSRRTIDKCGYNVRVNGVHMVVRDGNLVLSLPRSSRVMSLSSLSLPATALGLPAAGAGYAVPNSPRSVDMDSNSSDFGEISQPGRRPESAQGSPVEPVFEAPPGEIFEMWAGTE